MYFLIYHLSIQTLRVLTVTQCYIIITTTASVGLIIPHYGAVACGPGSAFTVNLKKYSDIISKSTILYS